MTKLYRLNIIAALILLIIAMQSQIASYAGVIVGNMQVEYTEHPLGIDVSSPRFGWQMVATAGERGVSQTAYQIIVKDPAGVVTWDSKKTSSSLAAGISYTGNKLLPATKYTWTVYVWDHNGNQITGSSWFETGLMNPDPGLSAWDGAKWIGGTAEDMVLYSPYLVIFNVRYTQAIAPGSTKASFIYGANDSRLMDRNKNIYQVESKKNGSYIKIELDISEVDGSENGTAKLNVYRSGYNNTDNPAIPLQSFSISTEYINNGNKNSKHTIGFNSQFGRITLSFDGNTSFIVQPPQTAASTQPAGAPTQGGQQGASATASVNVNPVGSGGNVIPFGMLCDIGFSVDAGQTAEFSDITVSNNRFPNNILFSENITAGNYTGIFSTYIKDPSKGLSAEAGKLIVRGGSAGTMITADPSRNSTPMLRGSFSTSAGKIMSARLYVTSRGIYEVYINGERVGDDYYNPGQTQYNLSHFYQTYDVTPMLKSGQNVIGAMLGEGWWSGLLSYGSIWNHFGDRQSLLAKLVVKYEDGSSYTFTTNEKWKYYNNGPVIYSSLDLGEVYDATKEAMIKGWATSDYNDNQWKNVAIVPLEGNAFIASSAGQPASSALPFDNMKLIGQIGNNAGIFTVLTAQSMQEVREGVYVYNMGQNFVGVPKITIANGKAGEKITIRVAEMLYPDLEESGNNVGMLMTENYRAALSQDVYTLKDGAQVFQPRFTSHGAQYIEITGIDEPLPLEAVQGVVISSVRKLTANYETSNPKVNRLWSNLVWSNIDNFLTLPTDCPQRNERMGWSGDINVFSRTATFVSNANQFLSRHMYAMRDVQTEAGRFTDIAPIGGGFGGVLWGSAGIVIPWETYLQYNDKGILESNYTAMARYIDYLATTIDAKTGLSSDNRLGDWLGPQNNLLGTDYLVTAYHIYDLWIMKQVAEILGKSSDVERFTNMHSERRAFFNRTFVNGENKTIMAVRPGRNEPADKPLEWKVADNQTSYAVGLALGAFNDDLVPVMAENLAAAVRRQNVDDGGVTRPEFSLMTGFIGTAWISKALSDNGLSEEAYRLLQNNQYPSWLYPIEQGATSIWERLNGYTVEDGFGGNNGMNSFNHYSFGAVGQWMISYSLGIQRGEPGFKTFVLQPEPDPSGEMNRAEGYYDSMYGRISSSWKVDGGVLTYKATVPANTSATLYLPAASESTVREGGKPASSAPGIKFIKFENGKAVYELSSGSFEFVTNL